MLPSVEKTFKHKNIQLLWKYTWYSPHSQVELIVIQLQNKNVEKMFETWWIATFPEAFSLIIDV